MRLSERERERKRDQRNLNPHAEAIMAMAVWGQRYAAQTGGSMDFWDKLTESEKRLCREWVSRIRAARRANLSHLDQQAKP